MFSALRTLNIVVLAHCFIFLFNYAYPVNSFIGNEAFSKAPHTSNNERKNKTSPEKTNGTQAPPVLNARAHRHQPCYTC